MENNQERAEAKMLTIRDVMGITIRSLESISIPAALMEMPPEAIMAFKQQVINPIENARRNLSMCVNAIIRAEEGQKAQEASKANEEETSESGEIVPLPTVE